MKLKKELKILPECSAERQKDRKYEGDMEHGVRRYKYTCNQGLRRNCGRQTPWLFIPLCNPLLLSVGRTCELLLANGMWMWQRWWNVISVNYVTLDCHICLANRLWIDSFPIGSDKGWQLGHLRNSSYSVRERSVLRQEKVKTASVTGCEEQLLPSGEKTRQEMGKMSGGISN